MNFPSVKLPRVDFPAPSMLESFSESLFEDLKEFIQDVEKTLKENQRIAFTFSQMGESVFVDRIIRYGTAFVLEGRDRQGTRMWVFAHMSSFQIALKAVEGSVQDAKEERKAIGFQVAG